MENTTKLNCKAPQCGYWRDEIGCSLNGEAGNGKEICDKGEARYEHQVFIIVDGGNVTAVYSDNPDIAIEVLDYDNARHDEENEDALDEMSTRVDGIEAKYHTLY
jgi:transcription elongation factor Elf1